MEGVFSTLGQVAGFGIFFIIVFFIVEMIPLLKLFPRVKYLTPLAIGMLCVLIGFLALREKGHGLSALIASLIVISLAIWYAIGGIRKGQEKLRQHEIYLKDKAKRDDNTL